MSSLVSIAQMWLGPQWVSIPSKFHNKFARVDCVRARLAILGPTPYVNYTGKLH